MAVYNAVELSSLSTRRFFLYNGSTSIDDVNGTDMEKTRSRFPRSGSTRGMEVFSSNQHGISKDEGLKSPDYVKLFEKAQIIEGVKQLNQSN